MEGAIYAIGIVIAELVLVAVVTWVVIMLRAESGAPEAEGRLAQLEREEEKLQEAA